MKTARTQQVIFGSDPVPLVPVSHFSSFDKDIIKAAWQLVGPSVAKNLGSIKPIPLWAIFAACYAEGVHHGMESMREQFKI